MDKLSLYIFQAPRTINVYWEYPPTNKVKWQGSEQNGYYHPDVHIYIAKAGCLKCFNHDLIGYHILLALQDANMPVNALRRKPAKKRKRKKETPGYVNLELWPSE